MDDPHKTEEAASDAAREGTNAWFSATMRTRLNDPATGAFIVVGHRVHDDDLFAHLQEEGGWELLRLPAEYEPNDPFLWPGDPRTEPGELLWPGHFNRRYIDELKRSLGSYGAAAQLQQSPTPATGGVFERGWWNYYNAEKPLPRFETFVQSWDLSFSGNSTSDYVVGQAWGKAGSSRFLLAERRDRLSFTQTIKAIREFTRELSERFREHSRACHPHREVGQRAGGYRCPEGPSLGINPVVP